MQHAIHSLQMLVNFHKTMWFQIPEDGILRSHHHGNLKTRITNLQSLAFNIK